MTGMRIGNFADGGYRWWGIHWRRWFVGIMLRHPTPKERE